MPVILEDMIQRNNNSTTLMLTKQQSTSREHKDLFCHLTLKSLVSTGARQARSGDAGGGIHSEVGARLGRSCQAAKMTLVKWKASLRSWIFVTQYLHFGIDSYA